MTLTSTYICIVDWEFSFELWHYRNKLGAHNLVSQTYYQYVLALWVICCCNLLIPLEQQMACFGGKRTKKKSLVDVPKLLKLEIRIKHSESVQWCTIKPHNHNMDTKVASGLPFSSPFPPQSHIWEGMLTAQFKDTVHLEVAKSKNMHTC